MVSSVVTSAATLVILMVSLPAPPKILSAPKPPVMVSSLIPPVIVSAAVEPTSVAAVLPAVITEEYDGAANVADVSIPPAEVELFVTVI